MAKRTLKECEADVQQFLDNMAADPAFRERVRTHFGIDVETVPGGRLKVSKVGEPSKEVQAIVDAVTENEDFTRAECESVLQCIFEKDFANVEESDRQSASLAIVALYIMDHLGKDQISMEESHQFMQEHWQEINQHARARYGFEILARLN